MAAVMIAALLAWQVRSVNASLEDMATRSHQDPSVRASIFQMKQQSGRLIEQLRSRGMTMPRVSIVAQGGYNVEFELAEYFAIKSRDDGGSLFHYRVERPYSWGEEPRPFTAVTTPAALEAFWGSFDIVWPVRTDAWSRNVIGRLVADPACRERPELYFLLRTGAGFECVPKGT